MHGNTSGEFGTAQHEDWNPSKELFRAGMFVKKLAATQDLMLLKLFLFRIIKKLK